MSSSTKQYLCDCGVTTNYKKYKNCVTTRNKATVQSSSDYIKKKVYNSVNCTGCDTKQGDLMIFYGNFPKVIDNIYTNVNATIPETDESDLPVDSPVVPPGVLPSPSGEPSAEPGAYFDN